MKKRALTLLLALAMCLSLCTPVMAEEVTPERTIVYTTTAEERDAIFEAEVEKGSWKRWRRKYAMPSEEMVFMKRTIFPDRKSTRLNSSHNLRSRMPSSA